MLEYSRITNETNRNNKLTIWTMNYLANQNGKKGNDIHTFTGEKMAIKRKYSKTSKTDLQ